MLLLSVLKHVETLAVTQVAKLLRALRRTGRLITVFTAGMFLSQLNSVCTVTRHFLRHILIITFCPNTDHTFSLPIGVPNTYSSTRVGTLTHCNTMPAVRRAEPSVTLLLILAFCQ